MTTLTELRAAFEQGLRDDQCVFVPPQVGLDLLRVMDACSGLLGLTQLLRCNDGLPVHVRDALESNHRVTEARAALAALDKERT